MQVDISRTDGKFYEQQSLILICVGSPEEIKVICSSVGRDTTAYRIFDGQGSDMGQRSFDCGMFNGPILKRLNRALVEDLNVLLEEVAVELNVEDFTSVFQEVVSICECKYGNGVEGGDCIITIQ